MWLELCEDLDALLGAYEENLEDQVKMRIRAFLSSGWAKPQTIAGQVEMDDKIEQVLDISDEDYQERLRGVLQRDLE